MIEKQSSEIKRAIVSYNPPEELWKLHEDYVYIDTEMHYRIIVERGSKYDLSTVPRLFWKIVSPFDLSNEAPLIHDFLYETEGGRKKSLRMSGKIENLETINENAEYESNSFYSPKEADILFRQTMEEAGVIPWRIFIGYWAVRLANFWRKWD